MIRAAKLKTGTEKSSAEFKTKKNTSSTHVPRRRKRNRLMYFASPNARPVNEVRHGEGIMGTVKDVGPGNSAWIDINVRTTRASPAKPRAVYARLRLDRPEVKRRLNDIKENIVLPVHVYKIAPDSARIEVRLGLIPPQKNEDDVAQRRPIINLQQSEELDGIVLAVGSYGAVVDVGVSRIGKKGKVVPFQGLLPRDCFAEGWAAASDTVRQLDTTRLIDVGDEVKVWVRKVRSEPPVLFLDAAPVGVDSLLKESVERQRNRNRYRRRKKVSTVSIGEVRRGLVREVAEFGLFIDLGLKRDVLVHFTETNVFPRPEPAKSWWKTGLPVGTPVHVKIIKIEDSNVAATLVELPLFQMEEARRIVQLPEATRADIKFMEALEERNKRINGLGVLVPGLNLDEENDSDRLSAEEYPPPASIDGQSNIDGNFVDGRDDGGDDDIDDDDIDDDDVDDDDQFSDDYFEDKYGY